MWLQGTVKPTANELFADDPHRTGQIGAAHRLSVHSRTISGRRINLREEKGSEEAASRLRDRIHFAAQCASDSQISRTASSIRSSAVQMHLST
jgi:hypothetical protein